MKRYLLCLLALSSIGCFSFLGLNAQTPGAIYFQAEARDSKGKILKEAALSVTIGIQDDTTSNIFIREQDFDVITDKYGLFTIVFGNPNISEDDFLYIYDLNGLDWGEEPLFVRPIISYKGETNYLSAIEILSVPYAFYSGKAHSALRADEVDWLDIDNMPPDFADGNDDVNDADADPENELITMAVLNGTNLEITDAGGTNTVDLSSISGETPSNTTYSIGLNESVGGYIFYITPDGKHGLVAGAQDASVSFYNWYYASDHCDISIILLGKILWIGAYQNHGKW